MASFSNSCGTTVVGGAVLSQINSCVGMSVILNHKATFTMWRLRNRAISPFAHELIFFQFTGTQGLGRANLRAEVGDIADYLYNTFINYTRPGLKAVQCPGTVCRFPVLQECNQACACADQVYFKSLADSSAQTDAQAIQSGISNYLGSVYKSANQYGKTQCDDDISCRPLWAAWVNAAGFAFTKSIAVLLNQQAVDIITNDYLYIWEELAGQPGKRLLEMVGKYYTLEERILASQEEMEYHVPVPFFYTRAPGKAIATAAMLYTHMYLVLCTEQLEKLIQVSRPDVKVLNASTGSEIQSSDVAVQLLIQCVFVDTQERDKLALSPFNGVFIQHQYGEYESNFQNIQLDFSHPILELNWIVKRQCHIDNNDFFNYSGLLGKDPLTFAEIRFNSSIRQQKLSAKVFRMVQPWIHHTCIPDNYIYTYSFSTFPEDSVPTGAANFSAFNTVTLALKLQEGLERIGGNTVFVFATSWNLLQHYEGVASAAFALS
jgi:hypothetical protein